MQDKAEREVAKAKEEKAAKKAKAAALADEERAARAAAKERKAAVKAQLAAAEEEVRQHRRTAPSAAVGGKTACDAAMHLLLREVAEALVVTDATRRPTLAPLLTFWFCSASGSLLVRSSELRIHVMWRLSAVYPSVTMKQKQTQKSKLRSDMASRRPFVSKAAGQRKRSERPPTVTEKRLPQLPLF